MKKGLVKIFVANAVSLLINLVLGFILPKKLSIDEYAVFRTFTFYAGYLGVLHLGYIDGVYLIYGGATISEIKKDKLADTHVSYLLFQTVIGALGLIGAIISGRMILIMVALAILPVNMASYYKNLYQATGEFKTYSNILKASSITTGLLVLGALFIAKSQEGMSYVYIYLFVDYVIFVILEINARRSLLKGIEGRFVFNELSENISQGFALLIGNFSSGLLSGMDRWFVKALLEEKDFAFYSFAVSTEVLINAVMTPFTTAFYNYLCICDDIDKIRKIKRCLYVMGLYLISAGFAVAFIVRQYISHYTDALVVMFVLFGIQIIYLGIRTIYINYFKAKKMQRQYMLQLFIVILVGLIFNIIAWNIKHCKESFAFGTLCTLLIWMLICRRTFPELRSSIRESLMLLLGLGAFIFIGGTFTPIKGFVIYLLAVTVIIVILIPGVYKEMKDLIFDKYRNRQEKIDIQR